MDSTAISSLPVVSVNDVLKFVAGVDVRQRGDMGAQTDISMRGGTSDQIAVYLDGINICDPQTGHNAMDIPLDVNDIERIEQSQGLYNESHMMKPASFLIEEKDERIAELKERIKELKAK